MMLKGSRTANLLSGIGIALCLGGAGCASGAKRFTPGTVQGDESRPLVETVWAVPPDKPSGFLKIEAPEVVSYRLGGEDRDAIPALRLKLVVSNNGTTGPWSLDTREQLIAYASGNPHPPFQVRTDQLEQPRLSVLPGERREIDLYFSLPAGVTDADAIETFTLRWRVHTPNEIVAETIPFNRADAPPKMAFATQSNTSPTTPAP